MTSKNAPKLFSSLMFGLSIFGLVSCTTFAPTPLPTAMNTITIIPTETSIPTATPSPTSLPSPTATVTAQSVSQTDFSVQSREQFEEWVGSGNINCQGSKSGGSSVIARFHDELVAAGIISEAQLGLGAGIPSTDHPTQCVFLITFYDGNSVIIYKDRNTGEYIKLPIIE